MFPDKQTFPDKAGRSMEAEEEGILDAAFELAQASMQAQVDTLAAMIGRSSNPRLHEATLAALIESLHEPTKRQDRGRSTSLPAIPNTHPDTRQALSLSPSMRRRSIRKLDETEEHDHQMEPRRSLKASRQSWLTEPLEVKPLEVVQPTRRATPLSPAMDRRATSSMRRGSMADDYRSRLPPVLQIAADHHAGSRDSRRSQRGERRNVEAARVYRTAELSRRRIQQGMVRWSSGQLRWAWTIWKSQFGPEILDDKWYMPFMISSISGFSLAWSLLMAVCILVVLIIEPLSAAFMENHEPLFLIWLNNLFDFLFIYDISVNFRTGVFLNGDLDVKASENFDAPLIARRYLRSWFLLDFFSSVPPVVQIILVKTTGDNQLSSSVRAIKVLKLGRILKVTKVLKFSQYFLDDESPTKDLLDEFMTSSRSLFVGKMAFLFFITILLAHLLACSMILSGPSWLREYGDVDKHNPAYDWSWRRRYVASFYWAVTTVSTVGYGDIQPHGTNERLYAIVAMVIGVWFYSYIIASVSSIVSSTDAKSAKYYEKMDQVALWMTHHAFNLELRRRVRAHFRVYYEQKTALDSREILEILSPSLQDEIAELLLPPCVHDHRLFRALPLGALAKVIPISCNETADAGSCLVHYGDQTSSLFFLVSGYCDCEAWVVEDEYTEEHTRETVIIGPGDSFGEYAVLGLHPTSLVAVNARTACSLIRIQQDAFLAAFSMLPETLKAMKRDVTKIAPRGFVVRR